MVLKIRTKMLLIFIVVVLISSAINIGIVGFAVQKSLTRDLISRIVVNTKAEVADLTNFVLVGNKGGIVDLIYNQKLIHKNLAHVLVLDESGKLIASTLINESPDAIIKDNFLPPDKNEQVVLLKTQDGRRVYGIALRLDYNKGILIAGYYKDQIDQTVRSIIYLLILGAVIAVVIALVFSILFSRTFFKPLDNLTDTVQRVGAGNLAVRAKVFSEDEFGFLATSFNSMTDHLVEYSLGLENKVAERTVELDKKMFEIEQINNLMVDRELKMIELKKEIKLLKNDKTI